MTGQNNHVPRGRCRRRYRNWTGDLFDPGADKAGMVLLRTLHFWLDVKNGGGSSQVEKEFFFKSMLQNGPGVGAGAVGYPKLLHPGLF
jgi:hypothetical protein